MEGKVEVNTGRDGVVLNMNESLHFRMKESEEEHVSSVHSSESNDNDDTLPVRTVHANNNINVPSGRQAEQIKELVDIACKTNQASKIMNPPPINHDAAILL